MFLINNQVRISLQLSSILLVFFMSFGFSISLYEVYEQAGPANGYDKYIVLEPDIVYTGGIGSGEESIYIEGNGAVVDLEQGTGIWIAGDSNNNITGSLDIDHCTIINGGSYGINLSGYSTNSITNCNLINVNWGIQVNDDIYVTIKNCNLIDNEYGLAIVGEDTNIELSYCNGWNNEYNYMYNCVG